ncbi:unnamed protein product [Rhizophagus irregularis]|uniref:Uncharacterized protein n=1 Tax=Rhizophagus irregularis TaxID=588596 RepID=A0A915ZI97_9GLOM|nr:unnamed protein product [Rhizophagus irregularis]
MDLRVEFLSSLTLDIFATGSFLRKLNDSLKEQNFKAVKHGGPPMAPGGGNATIFEEGGSGNGSGGRWRGGGGGI